MRATSLLSIAMAAILSSNCNLQAKASSVDSDAWTYKQYDSNLAGPDHWEDLFPTCQGQRQSPIDIVGGHCDSTNASVPLRFTGKCSQFHLKQTYESFKAEAVESSCTVATAEESYAFAQVHFHAPSEHTLYGHHRDGEVHFVHTTEEGQILVVALFLTKTKERASDPFLTALQCAVTSLDATDGADIELPPFFSLLQERINTGRVYNYAGGLTTPGCDEKVDWWVLELPLLVAESQFHELQKALKRVEAADNGKNARPTQPLHERRITKY